MRNSINACICVCVHVYLLIMSFMLCFELLYAMGYYIWAIELVELYRAC